MSKELILSIIIQLCGVTFFGGVLWATMQHQKEIVKLLTKNFENAIAEVKAQTEKTIQTVREEMEKNFKRIEEKQDKHNSVIERQFKTESNVGILSEKIDVANHRIEDLERVCNG